TRTSDGAEEPARGPRAGPSRGLLSPSQTSRLRLLPDAGEEPARASRVLSVIVPEDGRDAPASYPARFRGRATRPVERIGQRTTPSRSRPRTRRGAPRPRASRA